MAKIININIPVTEDEHKRLVEIKEGKTWREFLLRDLPIVMDEDVEE